MRIAAADTSKSSGTRSLMESVRSRQPCFVGLTSEALSGIRRSRRRRQREDGIRWSDRGRSRRFRNPDRAKLD
jgi:hypothetical protein